MALVTSPERQRPDVPSLALDIDTPEDLDALREGLESTHGGAAHTRGMIRQLMRSEI